MVFKRKNSAFNRDAFKVAQGSQQVIITEDTHKATVKYHKSSSFMWGLVCGFILNTAISVALAYTFADVNNSTITARIVENKLSTLTNDMKIMNEIIDPTPGKLAKEMNEDSSQSVR